MQSIIIGIEFSANCQTEFGDIVYICGNIHELGEWNPLKGLRLYTDIRLYPRWRSYRVLPLM